MSTAHPTSAQVRGTDRRATGRAVLLAATYTAFVVVGVLGLAVTAADPAVAGTWFFGLLVVLGVLGVVSVVQGWWFVRHRPGAHLGVAPSGRPAVVVPRSSSTLVMSLVTTTALLVFFAVGLVAALVERSGWALPAGLVVLLLAWPLVLAPGRVAVGGLYLTPAGIEHRRDAVTWTVTWQQVRAAAPREPVAVVLETGQRPVLHRTVRWVWDREVRAPDGVVGIRCRDLGLDGVLVAGAINTAVAHPDRRAELGTPAALSWGMFVV